MNVVNEIDPAIINTEEELIYALSGIGYKVKSAHFKNIKIIREVSSGDYVDEPCVWLYSG